MVINDHTEVLLSYQTTGCTFKQIYLKYGDHRLSTKGQWQTKYSQGTIQHINNKDKTNILEMLRLASFHRGHDID